MRVALVIGHKKKSPGASNKFYNISEFEFNEKLVKDISNNLNNMEIDNLVIYRDMPYSELPVFINNKGVDVVISFHCNAFNTKASGSEVLYYHKSVKGKDIASVLQKYIVECLHLNDRGIKACNSEDRGGYLLRHTLAPCVIIEPFFIDNNKDYVIAETNYTELCNSITNGIKDILNLL